jgi:hypothetical protein
MILLEDWAIRSAGGLAAIPKFRFKWTRDGTNIDCRVMNSPAA